MDTTVLIVDDQELIRDLLKDALEQQHPEIFQEKRDASGAVIIDED